jgi:hypothetical protein
VKSDLRPGSRRVAAHLEIWWSMVANVADDEVLLLWRALRNFRLGRSPACAPRGRPSVSKCPLYDGCPRWSQQDDYTLSMIETEAQSERRRAQWPCSRLLELLSPEVSRIN